MDIEDSNLAETIARLVPTAAIVYPPTPEVGDILLLVVPDNFKLLPVDTEQMLDHPRRTVASASFADADSFLAYVKRHARPESTVAWCDFNSQTFALRFAAVFDDHGTEAGWRKHRADFTPDMSAEWKAWKGSNTKAMDQVTFATWIQDHELDINSETAGMPTSLQMLAMATDFVAHEEHALKSTVRLNSGGVRLTYIADADKGTMETMQMFEKFALGIPVFHDGGAWRLTSRLKYRNNSGKVVFFYELQRPDIVHASAAKELIAKVRENLGNVPMFMGRCD